MSFNDDLAAIAKSNERLQQYTELAESLVQKVVVMDGLTAEVLRLNTELVEAKSFRLAFEHATKIEREEHDREISRLKSELAQSAIAVQTYGDALAVSQAQLAEAQQARDATEYKYQLAKQHYEEWSVERDTANELLRRAERDLWGFRRAQDYPVLAELYAAISAHLKEPKP